MSTGKIFISHISEERVLARLFERWIQDVFPSKCAIFVSSAPDSIPPGSVWFEKIASALRKATVTVSLLSPRSMKRPWITFEAATGWMKEIPVIEVLHSGLRVSDVEMPLSMFQMLELHQDQFPNIFFSTIAEHARLGRAPARIDYNAFRNEVAEAISEIVGPEEVVRIWNQALRDRQPELARKYTSKTSDEFIRQRWGSLDKLSEKYQKSNFGTELVESVIVGPDTAKVSYTTVYRDESYSVKTWEDILFLEDGIWKLAPQYVVWSDKTERSRLKK